MGWIWALKKQEEEERTPDLGLGDGDMGCQRNGEGGTDLEAYLDQQVALGHPESLGWGSGGCVRNTNTPTSTQ